MPTFDRSASSGSLASSVSALSDWTDSDWDRSSSDLASLVRPTTPQNSVPLEPTPLSSSSIVFPASSSASFDPASEHTPRRRAITDLQALTMDDRTEANPDVNADAEFAEDSILVAPRKSGKRTLSDLLQRRVGSASEAHRIADVLGQWINASSSPYEPETDDFFSPSDTPCTPSTSLSFTSKSTPPTPSHSHAGKHDLSDAPGRRGSITNRGGVTVVINPRPGVEVGPGDATSVAAQPHSSVEAVALGEA